MSCVTPGQPLKGKGKPAADHARAPDRQLVETALNHVQNNEFAVFPVARGSKLPHRLVRRDRDERGNPVPGTGGVKKASQDTAVVRAWFREDPEANLAIATGTASGFDVLDIDPAKGGADSLERLLMDLAIPALPSTWTQQTPSGGRHYCFQHDGRLKNWVDALGPEHPGLDIRTSGGFILTEPSVRKGNQYIWDLEDNPSSIECAQWPSALLAKILDEHKPAQSATAAPFPEVPESEVVSRASAYALKCRESISGQGGSRDTFHVCCSLVRTFPLAEEGLMQALGQYNAQRCTPPWSEDELRHKVQDALKAETYRGGYTRAADVLGHSRNQDLELTDLGNSMRLVQDHGEDLFFTPETDWIVWTGARYEVDALGAAQERAKATAAALLGEARALPEGDERTRRMGWGRKSQEARRIASMLGLARSDPRIAARFDGFDADRYLVNVENGTVDLRSGELRPHRRSDRITKLAPVAYSATPRAPRWDAFLRDILPDPDVRAFVQRLVGYSLSGDPREQVLAVLHGVGANGKSTLVEAVRSALGDYSGSCPFSALLPQRPGHIPNDIASLVGRRFVVAQEPDEGVNLSESTVKLLTGQDRVPARFMRKEFFEFVPSHTLFLTCNHLPEIKGTDGGIWRRVLLVPFEVVIPAAKRDLGLGAALQRELPGILAWAVEGHRQWREGGLRPPERVHAATKSYRDDSDQIGRFVEEACTVGASGLEVKASLLRQRYEAWCRENGEVAQSAKWVASRLKGRGYIQRKRSSMFWVGLSVPAETSGVCLNTGGD